MSNDNDMSKLKSTLAFVAFLFLLVVAEVACAKLAWHTVGEIHSALLLFLVWFNLVPLLIYLLRFKKLAVGLALFAAVLIISHQIYLGYRWHMLRQETLNAVAYVNKVKRQTGSYSKNLSAYTYLHLSLKADIIYTYYKPSDYAVRFHVGSPNTEHWYEAGKGWWYYPD